MNDLAIKDLVNETRSIFKDHKAIMLVDTDDVQVMDWKRPGSSFYAMRCVINRNHMTITGDVGTAVFDLTWFPTFESTWNEDYDYLRGKIKAWSEESETWSSNKAEGDIERWYEEQTEEHSYSERILKKLSTVKLILEDCVNKAVEYTSTGTYWRFWFELEQSSISEYDHEWYETFEHIGKTTPMRFYIWIEGLRMASSQLRGEL